MLTIFLVPVSKTPRNRVSNTHASAWKLSEVLIDKLAKCSIALAVQKLIERAIEKIKETAATP
ncbi:hypothetical protein [Microcoleus vaginatus]|uniref:hypothetical protein n=1 Tax=Microcoleus vaginatus TaxID=119532 RepID=UPI0032A4463D